MLIFRYFCTNFIRFGFTTNTNQSPIRFVVFHLYFNLCHFLFCLPFVFFPSLPALCSSCCLIPLLLLEWGCLFSNTSQPPYLLGLYFSGLLLPTPFVIVPSTPLISHHHQMDIRVCVTVICAVACNCYLEIVIVYNRHCVRNTKPVCLYGWMYEACMCLIGAWSTAYVPKCIMVLCMTISSDRALPPCWLWLFIRRGVIILPQLLDVWKQESLCLWVSTVLFHSICWIWNCWVAIAFCCTNVPAKLYWIVFVLPGLC